MADANVTRGTAQRTSRTSRRRVRSVGKLFISYRRDDSATIAGRIHDWLVQRVPSDDVFFDIDSIEYGADFERRIQQTIPRCKAVIAVIGPQWITREGHPSQQVIRELELAQSSGVQIFPVLIAGASMPREEQVPRSLAGFHLLNAAQVRDGRDFQHDMEDLAKALGIPISPRAFLDPRRPRFWVVMAGILILLSLAAAGLLTTILPRTTTTTNPYAAATLTVAVASETDAAASQSTAAIAVQNTAVAATASASSAATATASVLAPYSYTAQVPGPGQSCDPKGQWQLTPDPAGGTYNCLADHAHMTSAGSIAALVFQGASGFNFPTRYTVSVDLASLDRACVWLDVVIPSGNQDGVISFMLCSGGNWSAQESYTRSSAVSSFGQGGVPTATSYQVALTFTGSSIEFSINGQHMATASEATEAATQVSVQMESNTAALGSVDLSNFTIAALP